MLFQVTSKLILVSAFDNLKQRHFLALVKSASQANFQSCLALVTRQHPYFDACCSELLYALFNIVLQQIFNCCDPKNSKIALYRFYRSILNVHEISFSTVAKGQNSQAFRSKLIG